MFVRQSIRLTLLAALMALAVLSPARSQSKSAADFFFHDGDMPIVFLGDSITEQKMYTTLIETYALTRFPNNKMTFRNTGWGGDTAWLQKRGSFESGLQRDVLSLQPKAITIDFGMNDASGGDTNYPKYLEYSTKLVEALKKAGTRVVLITPSAKESYEPGEPGGNQGNVMLKKYSDGLKGVAAKEDVLFVDQFTPFVKAIEEGRKAGVLSKEAPVGATNVLRLVKPDTVHPEWPGHLVMAIAILQGLRAPALVSAAFLDAATRSTVAVEKCAIEWQDAPGGAVQFKRTDEALPWPTPVESDLTLKIPGFDAGTTLNRYELKVAGLREASYKLTIDGQGIGTYSKGDLANGVNLGFVRQGPIYDQGQKLLKAVEDKNDIYFNRWRGVQLFSFPDWMENVPGAEEARTAELATLDKAIAGAEQVIKGLRKPVPHVFKLEPIK